MIAYRETSREAWHSIEDVAGELDREILQAIKASEPVGITCQAIEERLDRLHQAVSGNLRHLVERGYVEASGRFGQTRSGRRAIRWILSKPPAAAPEPEIPTKQMDLWNLAP
jgi:predicted transcriptional regulator